MALRRRNTLGIADDKSGALPDMYGIMKLEENLPDLVNKTQLQREMDTRTSSERGLMLLIRVSKQMFPFEPSQPMPLSALVSTRVL